MTETTLSVPEIHCDHCKMSIEGAVGALDGVDRGRGRRARRHGGRRLRRPGHHRRTSSPPSRSRATRSPTRADRTTDGRHRDDHLRRRGDDLRLVRAAHRTRPRQAGGRRGGRGQLRRPGGPGRGRPRRRRRRPRPAAVDRLGYSATRRRGRRRTGEHRRPLRRRRPATRAAWPLLAALFTIPAFLLTMFGPDERWATRGRVGADHPGRVRVRLAVPPQRRHPPPLVRRQHGHPGLDGDPGRLRLLGLGLLRRPTTSSSRRPGGSSPSSCSAGSSRPGPRDGPPRRSPACWSWAPSEARVLRDGVEIAVPIDEVRRRRPDGGPARREGPHRRDRSSKAGPRSTRAC